MWAFGTGLLIFGIVILIIGIVLLIWGIVTTAVPGFTPIDLIKVAIGVGGIVVGVAFIIVSQIVAGAFADIGSGPFNMVIEMIGV